MTAVAVNDAPMATNLSAGETYTEDTALDLTDIVVSDVDSANVTVTLTLSDSSAGQSQYRHLGGRDLDLQCRNRPLDSERRGGRCEHAAGRADV